VPDRPDSAVIADLRRSLAFYRLVFALLVLGLFGIWAYPRWKWSIETYDLTEDLKHMTAAETEITDLSRTYYASPELSVHMHVMGKTQRCPLHIHPHGDELTAIVGGVANVAHAYASQRDLAESVHTFVPGDVIYSPPSCAHEWVNPSDQNALGNLVFSWPGFGGNLYVHPDDPRMTAASAPTLSRVRDDLAAFAQSAEQVRTTVLGQTEKRVRLVFSKEQLTLPAAQATAVWVRAGDAVLKGRLGRTYTLHSNQLAVLRHNGAVTLAPSTGEPMAVVVAAVE